MVFPVVSKKTSGRTICTKCRLWFTSVDELEPIKITSLEYPPGRSISYNVHYVSLSKKPANVNVFFKSLHRPLSEVIVVTSLLLEMPAKSTAHLLIRAMA